MASLVLRPSIKKAATTLNYETHVKWWCWKEGCHPREYQTPFLKQVRKGLRKMLPSRSNVRAALLFPKYVFTRIFARTNQRQQCLLWFATIIGFIGMLRPHTFRQLQPASFTLVVQNNDRRLPPRLIRATCRTVFTEEIQMAGGRVLGFFINYKLKTMINATSYFPSLSACTLRLKVMCSVTALRDLISGHLFEKRFLKKRSKCAIIISQEAGCGRNHGITARSTDWRSYILPIK